MPSEVGEAENTKIKQKLKEICGQSSKATSDKSRGKLCKISGTEEEEFKVTSHSLVKLVRSS